MIVLNYILLKQSIHRHNYVALLFIISGLIFISLKGISLNSYIFISILCNFLLSVLIILEVWIMEYRYLSPYELIGFKGFYGIIFLTLILILSNFTKCEKWMGICEYDEKNPKNIIDFGEELSNIFKNWYNVFQVISFIILTMFYNIFQELTMKHLGPTHRIVIDGVFSILSIILSFILNSTVLLIDFLLLQIFGHLFILIGIVIYNEIVIIKLCGLDVNTNKQIKERATGADDNKMMVILPLYEKNELL